MIFSKNSLLALVSVVAFIALAALSAKLYSGEPGEQGNIEKNSIWARTAVLWDMAASDTGDTQIDDSDWQPELSARLAAAWREGDSEPTENSAYISEKIENIYEWIKDRLSSEKR